MLCIFNLRAEVYERLRQAFGPNAPLLRLWATSYVDGGVLVLPAEAAVELAAADPGGYHTGVWHLATQYEAVLAGALLTNSNASAPGYQQPKSFSAWPRRHDVVLYRQASTFSAALSEDVLQTSSADRRYYLDLIELWHSSVTYISQISGHTRLDRHQLQQLCVSFRLRHWLSDIPDNHPPSPAHTSDSEDTATEKWHYHLIKKFFSRWRRTAHSMALSHRDPSNPCA
jgi:hypothetical protein